MFAIPTRINTISKFVQLIQTNNVNNSGKICSKTLSYFHEIVKVPCIKPSRLETSVYKHFFRLIITLNGRTIAKQCESRNDHTLRNNIISDVMHTKPRPRFFQRIHQVATLERR